MDKPEYLIVEWNLCDWQALSHTGADINQKCRPMLKKVLMLESAGGNIPVQPW